MAKVGLDDYFLTHTVAEFDALPLLSVEEIFDEEETQELENWRHNKQTTESIPLIGGRRRDDIGNGDRFVDQHGAITRWSTQLGWRHYDGIRWRDNNDRGIERMAESVARSIFVEASRTRDKDEAEKIGAWAVRSSAMAGVRNMLESTKNKSGMAVDQEEFDKDPWLLNLKNGTYDLKNSIFREHRSADHITKLCGAAYIPEAECPIWRKFLARVIPNFDTRHYLQRCAGYSLTGSIDEQCFFLLYGTGKNGKSKFLEGISSVLGDYSGVMRTEALMLQKYDNNKGDIAILRKLRFVYAVEPVSTATLNTSFIKQQTGGEKLTGEFKYRDAFSFMPTHKLWIGANHDIKFPDTDEGIRRRVKQIPFKVWIPEEERDPLLGEKFLAEASGVLNWLLDGLKMYLAEGLGMPPEVKEATEAYFGRIDPLKDFIDECLDRGEGYHIKPSELFKRYTEWAKSAGERRPLSRNHFYEHMTNLGFKQKQYAGIDHFEGVDLKYLKTKEKEL